MSSKPRHGDPVATTSDFQSVVLNKQMQAFMDELENALKEIESLKERIEALENA